MFINIEIVNVISGLTVGLKTWSVTITIALQLKANAPIFLLLLFVTLHDVVCTM